MRSCRGSARPRRHRAGRPHRAPSGPRRSVARPARRRSPPGSAPAWCRGSAPRRRPGRAPRPARAAPPCTPAASASRAPSRPARGCGRGRLRGSGGCVRRAGSRPESRSSAVMVPVRNPRPSGEYGTRPMPSSRSVGRISSSRSRVHSEYSDCRAVIGCVACARRIVAASASDSPRWATLPAATSSAIAPTVSSMARSGRPGAGSTGRCGRRPAGAAWRRRRADVLGTAVDRRPGAVGQPFVAELRRELHLVTPPWIARPTSCSFVNGPYMSAVSSSVTPRSRARWMVAIALASSVLAVELRHAHAAEAEGGDGQRGGGSEGALSIVMSATQAPGARSKSSARLRGRDSASMSR